MIKMSEYPKDKYKYYYGNRKVVAVSSYAGKTVRGVAVCAPNDEFDETLGKDLACARCASKIANKRLSRATKKYNEALIQLQKAIEYYNEMTSYYTRATDEVDECAERLQNILENA